MDAANCVVWGQVLGDAPAVAAGAAKLDRWIAFTGAGAPYEYNSPTYLAIDLEHAGAAGRARRRTPRYASRRV